MLFVPLPPFDAADQMYATNQQHALGLCSHSLQLVISLASLPRLPPHGSQVDVQLMYLAVICGMELDIPRRLTNLPNPGSIPFVHIAFRQLVN